MKETLLFVEIKVIVRHWTPNIAPIQWFCMNAFYDKVVADACVVTKRCIFVNVENAGLLATLNAFVNQRFKGVNHVIFFLSYLLRETL